MAAEDNEAARGASRRDFLRLGMRAASAALLPPAIRRALALPASSRDGTIEDVGHIVVFMQENRSFDHYFGHLSGVRGYNDRHPVRRVDGRPVWFQPRRNAPDKIVLPFYLRTKVTSAECVLDLDHNWYPTQRALAAGRNDQWPANKTDLTMGYYLREDIPFHYALADAFTICDNYFCATPTQTHPNRMYLMTGMVDPTGKGGGPLLDNSITSTGSFIGACSRRHYHRRGGSTVRFGARADGQAERLVLTLVNTGGRAETVRLRDAAYGAMTQTVILAAGARVRLECSVAVNGHWYDIVVDGPGGEATRLAGHVETGRASITDPAATAPVLKF